MPGLNIEIDPRIRQAATVHCAHCGAPFTVTHKELRRSFMKRDRLLQRFPKVVPANDYIQLAEFNCSSCGQSSILHYDFTEFAMSAYAFRIVKIDPC